MPHLMLCKLVQDLTTVLCLGLPSPSIDSLARSIHSLLPFILWHIKRFKDGFGKPRSIPRVKGLYGVEHPGGSRVVG